MTHFDYDYCEWSGLVSSISNASLTAEYASDILDRVTNITYRTADSTVVHSFDYSYNTASLITQQICIADGQAVTNRYTYDGLGRLITANDISNTYDLAGNRLTAGAETYTYTHNRLDGVSYDAAGNVTSMVRDGVTLSLVWNSQYQLVSVSTNNVLAESYQYDTIGRRIATTTYPLPLGEGQGEGETTFHIYDGDECVADLDDSGNPLRIYLWGSGIDNLLAMTVFMPDSTNTYYAVKDHLGSVHALIDEQGQVAERYEYDTWGCVLGVYDASGLPISNQQSQIENRFLFQGREWSYATGLYNFRARWYDPITGRWLSNDPIGISGGLNLYQFCGSNPVNIGDSYGLAPQLIGVDATGRAYYSSDRDWGDYDSRWGGRGISSKLSVLKWGERSKKLGELYGWPYAHVLANAGITQDHYRGTAWLMSLGKEIIDLVKGISGNEDSLYSAFQSLDFKMNRIGRSIPPGTSPYTWAKPYENYPEGPPGPFYRFKYPDAGSNDCE